jgi:hypothetical protein
MKLKDYVVIQDSSDGELEVCPKEGYEEYVRKALMVGAAPSWRVITHFDLEDDLLKSESIPSVKNINTMYEVLAGNRVRKKLDKPEPKRTDYNIEHMTLDQEYAVFKTAYAVWKDELEKQPIYPISGSHNWKEGQLIEEGKDFEFGMKERKINEKYHALDPNSKVVYPIPSVTEEDGWTYDYKFLNDLTNKVNESEWGEGLSMEQVEAVLIAINFQPSSSSLHS